VVTTRYDSRSAGNRTLHLLCHALNLLGEEAYLFVTTPGAPGEAPLRLLCPVLTQTEADRHFSEGRTPVFVRPEAIVYTPPGGVWADFILNYLGVLGGPAAIAPETDLVFAFSRRIAASLSRSSHVLFLPAIDLDYWSLPEPGAPRAGVCAYLGKRRDVYGLGMAEGDHADIILTRETPRDALREAFRSSEMLLIYENSTLIGEALLCGCPVVCGFNDKFPDLLGGEEFGSDGVLAAPASREDVARAAGETWRFRARVEAAEVQAVEQLRQFIAATQTAPLRRPLSAPVEVPNLALARWIERLSTRSAGVVASVSENGVAGTLSRAFRSRMK
jgi:hypothetical protein